MRCASTVIAESAMRHQRRQGGPLCRGVRSARAEGRLGVPCQFSLLGLSSALLVLVSGCGQFRGLDGDLPACQDYQTVVQPLLNQRCVVCHGADRAEGGYRLTTRLEALARRDDGTTRVVNTDGGAEADALVLVAARGDSNHDALVAEEQAALKTWVVDCKAGGRRLYFHPRGWSTPTSPVFHGDALRGTGYQIDGGSGGGLDCRKCHGDDLKGGKAEVSCHECHGETLFACDMCHGTATSFAPPRALSGSKLTTAPGVGAHQTHLRDGALHRAYGCGTCHVMPVDPFQEGHFQGDGGTENGRAEVAFDGGRGEYSFDAHTCANTSCHAPAPDSGTNQLPTWTKVGQGEAACGTCHGIPPATHSTEKECGLCHKGAYVDGGVVVQKHADGTINLGRPGDATLTCSSCHGDAVAFRDLHDSTDSTVLTVGAHQAHLEGRHGIAAPLQCNQCHRVPTEVRSPGHIDQPLPAIVFPLVADGGSIAWNDGAMPAWDRVTGTCSSVYCHGLGGRGTPDHSPSKVPQVQWTGGTAQVYCGSCHGLPPTTGVHLNADAGLLSCHRCHEDTINASGSLKVTRGADGGIVTTHMNGVLDLGRDGGGT